MLKISLDKTLLRAKLHAKKGEIEDAQKLYQTVLQTFPKNKRAQKGLADLEKLKQPTAAQGPPQGEIHQLLNLYNQGQLELVVEQAKALASSYPEAFFVWNILGAASKGLGKTFQAAAAFKKVTELNPKYAAGFNNLGIILTEHGELEEAIVAYNKALLIKPDYSHAYKNMGNTLKKQGKLEEALEAYLMALAINREDTEACYNMGVTLQELGKLEEAVEAYNKTIVMKPDNADAHYNMGIILQDQGKLNAAIEAYNTALAITPDCAYAYNNKGNALKDQGKLEEAIEAYNKALSIQPDCTDAHNNKGNALQDQCRVEEAIEAYKKALFIEPDNAEAYNNMGKALKDQDKLDEAIEAYNTALAIKPDYAEAYINMGATLKQQGKLKEAIEAYKKALAIEPDHAEGHYNMSFALLAAKDFYQGFKCSEWRWNIKKPVDLFLKSTKPLWNGEKKQRVLVWAEQGIGDELMFSSIIPELYSSSSQILVKCDKRLIPLFRRSFPADVAYFSKDQLVPENEYDFHIPMGSLPLNFRKSLDSFEKSASGYLTADTIRSQNIRSQILQGENQRLVGLSWKTKSTIKNAITRNVPLHDLALAFKARDTKLISLQYGDVLDEIQSVKRDLGIEIIQIDNVDNLNDIDGLAALMAASDMVATIDNVTTHLSGALGVTTKLMLPFKAEWRWGVADDISYWYGSVQLHRQSAVNDWQSVLAEI